MTPVPTGFRLLADTRTRRYDGDRVLVGGAPRRVLRLSERGAQVARDLLDGAPVRTPAQAALARRLLDGGLAHPEPGPAASTPASVEVVIPAYDDTSALRRCLTALGGTLPVLVVDDGSGDASAVRDVATAHGADVLRLEQNHGPAAARNAGARAARAAVVAFVDSDAVVDAATLERVAAHLADDAVAAAAPRIRPIAVDGASALTRFAATASPLDLGAERSIAAPHRRVPYVPSTVLLVRRAALLDIGGFDETMRFGEDVDLVWRLDAAGHRVRYVADVEARHAEPSTWRSWLTRRFRYGTSAAPLAVRHGRQAGGVTMQPAPLAVAALAVAGRRRVAVAVAAVTAARVAAKLHRAGVPATPTVVAAAMSPVHTALSASRWSTQLWWPVLLGTAVASRRRRTGVAVVAVAPALVTWAVRRPRLDPARWVLASWADDVAYGLGVWRGCARERVAAPLLPRLQASRRDR